MSASGLPTIDLGVTVLAPGCSVVMEFSSESGAGEPTEPLGTVASSRPAPDSGEAP